VVGKGAAAQPRHRDGGAVPASPRRRWWPCGRRCGRRARAGCRRRPRRRGRKSPSAVSTNPSRSSPANHTGTSRESRPASVNAWRGRSRKRSVSLTSNTTAPTSGALIRPSSRRSRCAANVPAASRHPAWSPPVSQRRPVTGLGIRPAGSAGVALDEGALYAGVGPGAGVVEADRPDRRAGWATPRRTFTASGTSAGRRRCLWRGRTPPARVTAQPMPGFRFRGRVRSSCRRPVRRPRG
jgi:hypothetical protein